MSKSRIIIPREVLLVEIERRCIVRDCNALARFGLIKDEARSYIGFECERCKTWNRDSLSERDVPEWWGELAVTGLFAVRERQDVVPDVEGEFVTRMSESYRRTKVEKPE